MEERRWRRTIRISAVAAVPRSRPAPYTRYTTCRLSTTTIGSATAIPRLCLPEVEEPEDDRRHRPAGPQPPQATLSDHWVAELAESDVVVVVREMRVQGALVSVERCRPWLAISLTRQDRVPDQ